jgi:hypothetical protein
LAAGGGELMRTEIQKRVPIIKGGGRGSQLTTGAALCSHPLWCKNGRP